jgi:hypothetical protein
VSVRFYIFCQIIDNFLLSNIFLIYTNVTSYEYNFLFWVNLKIDGDESDDSKDDDIASNSLLLKANAIFSNALILFIWII